MRAERRSTGWAISGAFAVVYVVWGSTYLGIRLGLETIPPFLLAGTRFLAAGAILCGWAAARGARRPGPADWKSAATAGFLMFVLGNGGVTWAEQHVPSGIAALLVASEPSWLVVLAWWSSGGPRPSGRVASGLVLGLVGVGVLVRPGGIAGTSAGPFLAGAVAILASAVAWAAGSLFIKRARLPESPAMATGMQMLAGGAILMALGFLGGEARGFDPGAISARSGFAWAYLVVFGSTLAFSAYAYLIGATTPARLSTYAYVNPVVAMLLGRVAASEPIPPAAWLAMVVIVASVALINAGPAEPEPVPAPGPGPIVADVALAERA